MLSLKMALRSIGANKMRAALTMLGIIIGVVALVVLVSLVNGATGSVTDSVSSLGTNMLTVSISDDKGLPLDLETVNGYMNEEGIGLVAPYQTASLTAGGEESEGDVTVYGITPAFYEAQGMQLAMGRFLKTSDVDNHTYVCVINETAATELIGYTDCVDQAIRLNGVEYTIVGVLSDNEDSLTSVMSAGSLAVYLPYTSLLRLSDSHTGEVTSFYVTASEGSTTEAAEAAMTAILMERFEEDDEAFSISSQNVLEDTVNSITSVLTILLGGIAAISLVVGGIGIMNIMLVTVTERTREIGIRKAIGAERRSIIAQFLIEAAVICSIGGVIGILIGYMGTMIAGKLLLGEIMTPSTGIAVGAFLFSVVLGILFGMYPAIKASGLQPVAALRAD